VRTADQSVARRSVFSDPVSRWALVASVAWVAGYAVLTALSRGSAPASRFVGDILYIVPVAAGVVAAALASRRGTGRHRMLWRVLAVAYAAQFGGEVIYSGYDYLVPSGVPDVSAADAGYLTASALTLVAVVIGFGSAGALRHFRGLLDTGLILVSLGGLGWQIFIKSQWAGSQSWTDLVALAYPVLDVAVISCVSIVGLGGHRGIPLAVRLVGLAAALNAISDMVYTYLLTFNSYDSGGWLDVCFEAGATCSFLAAVIALRLPERPAERRDFDRGLTLLPILTSTAACFTLVIFQKVRSGTVDSPTLLTCGLLFLAVLLRQYLFTADRAALAEQLRQAVGEQQRLADTDALTGLHNRRFLTKTLAEREQQDPARPLSLLMIDLDRFKQINDTYGHPAGDAVLQAAAARIVAACRRTDVVARVGGEEFVVLLPGVGPDEATATAEAIRRRISAEPVRPGVLSIALTTSIGVASQDGPGRADLLRLADQALYQAKALGRDRVVTSQPPPDVTQQLAAVTGP